MSAMLLDARQAEHPALARLAALTPLDGAAVEALERALAALISDRPRSELQSEGRPVPATLLVAEGWAARMRILPDGRRQFLSFVLPGELIGHCRHERPLALSTVVAITALKTCRAPDTSASPALARAYALSHAYEEAHLLAQITRLGRLHALERVGDVMLELRERLALAGLVRRGGFDMPMTQEQLSDVLGLTPVHLNRMIQQARRRDWFEWRAKRVTFPDPAALADEIGRRPVKVQVG